MANFNTKDPRYQRDLQRARAKGLATGNIPKTKGVVAAHAQHQLNRQLQFESLGLQSKLSKLRHELNLAILGNRDYNINLAKRQLRKDKSNLNWTIGLGLGQLGFSTLEGQRRRNILKKDLEERERRWKLIEDRLLWESTWDKSEMLGTLGGLY